MSLRTVTPTPTWRELFYPRPLDADQATNLIRAVATDPRSPLVVLEARGSRGGVRYLLGTEAGAVSRIASALGAVALGLSAPRKAAMSARRIGITNRQRSLNTEALAVTAPAILAALTACGADEELTLQVVLGARLSGLVVPSTARQPVPVARLLVGYPTNNRDGRMDAEARLALVKKVCEPGFTAVVRIGVVAPTSQRRQSLVLGLLGALRLLEMPGISLYLSDEKPARVDQAKAPWRWPLRLNVREVAAVAALPATDPRNPRDLPGLPPLHPRPLAPVGLLPQAGNRRIVVARATAPGLPPDAVLTRSTDALLRHTQVVGPTGVGKSVLLARLALADIDAGRAVVVIEPKGDLVRDVLARIPEYRRGDVVVLDPSAKRVVGLNPLAGSSSPQLRADGVLSIFTDLFGSALGPRTTDILHSCLLTLARRSDTSLIQIPRLLTDATFRRQLVGPVASDLALGPFWAWYDALGNSERASVIAPLMNKLRAVLLRPSIRNVLGQVDPRFDVREVFTSSSPGGAGKILLVPLPVATLGAEGSALLGSLVVSKLWDAARDRTTIDPKHRHPVNVVLDEAQQFLRLSTDLADALAISRSYGVGWTLAHQYLAQLPSSMRSAVLTNCRSRIVFQTTRDDAKVFAQETGGDLEVEDFTRLPAFNVYASLLERGAVQPYVSGATFPLPEPTGDPQALLAASGERFGRPRDEIEAEFASASGTTSHTSGGDQPTGEGNAGELSTVPRSPSAVGSRARTLRTASEAASGRSSGRVEIDVAPDAPDCTGSAENPDASSPSSDELPTSGGEVSV